MGFLDSLFGDKDDDDSKGVKGPSMVLREAGIDPAGLKFQFGSDGTVTVMGEVMDEARRSRIGEVLQGMEQVSAVDNQLNIASPGPDALAKAESDSETVTVGGGSEPTTTDAEVTLDGPDVDGAAPTDAQTYTVQSGDSLWKIAEQFYGKGAEYMKIFEANRDQLDNPDLIRPGQVLNIPPKA